MRPIALITATPPERDALLRCLPGWKPFALGSLQCKRLESNGQTCLLITCGMGARRAAASARMLIETAAPRLLFSFGVAGAVEASLRIGDGVLVEAACALNQGLPGPLLPLASFPPAARDAAARVLAERGARLYSGMAVTTAGSQEIHTGLAKLPHPVLEMETVGIAEVAAEFNIPLLAVRAISDAPCAPLPVDLGALMDEDANLRVGRLLMQVLRRPGMLLQSRRFLSNARLAADHAALAVAAMLGWL